MSVNSIGYIHLGGNIRNITILLLLSLSFGIEKPFIIDDPNITNLEISFLLPEYSIKQDDNYHYIESTGKSITPPDHPEVPVFTTFIQSGNKMGYNIQIIAKDQLNITEINLRPSEKLIK